MSAPILVVGATGNVGRAVVDALRREGLRVRATTRHGENGDVDGVETVPLDLYDPKTFRAALAGVDGLFLLRPPSIVRVGSTLHVLIDAAAEEGVGHVVFSSVAGAERNPFVPHHRIEGHLRSAAPGWTILRPGFFAQNLGDAYRSDIAVDDRLHVPAGDGRVAFVDVRDLADVVAEIFRDPTPHRGMAYTLTGPRAFTFGEAAQVLTSALDRPIRYEPATVAGYVRHLRARGLPTGQIAVQLILHLTLRSGDAARVDPTLAQLLGREGRPLDEYIADHRALWRRDAPKGRTGSPVPLVERIHPPDAVMHWVNPVMRRLLVSRAHGLVSRQLLILHYTGRRTGVPYDVPVGYRHEDRALEVLTNSGWRVNFRGGRSIEVTLHGHRRAAHAVLIDDPETVATTYRRLIDDMGMQRAQRRLGIRVNAAREPTLRELADAVDRLGMSIVRLELTT